MLPRALEAVTSLANGGLFESAHNRTLSRFVEGIVPACSGTEIHVILDERPALCARATRWAQRYANVSFHQTPSYASWLSQLEIWFSIFSKSAKSDRLASARQVREAVDRFVQAFQPSVAPFEWTRRGICHAVPSLSQVGASGLDPTQTTVSNSGEYR